MFRRSVLKKILSHVDAHSSYPFRVVFSDGSVFESREGVPQATITFKTGGAEWRAILFGGIGMMESYIAGSVDIDADFQTFFRLHHPKNTEGVTPARNGFENPLDAIRNRWHEFLRNNRTIARARRNGVFHYDRGTSFFKQYLDKTLTYTCAYWKEGVRTLDEAQEAKLEHVCRKLRLEPGQTLVDVGAGWGSLLFHAYQEYGVFGTSYGIAPDQNEWLANEIQKRNLEGKVAVVDGDFREVRGQFDRYASLGVYEHAGVGQLEDWIRSMTECLKPGGIGVLHFIGTTDRSFKKTGIFIRKYIFPGGYLPGLDETIRIMGTYGLEVLDVENLRRHYNLTLIEWAKNFEKNWPTIRKLDPKRFDERLYRTWRIYLWACADAFVNPGNDLHLFQITFSRGNTKTYPMTRTFLYEKTGVGL